MNRSVLSILCLALLAGCVSPTPTLDANFGNAVRTVRAMQTVNPDAGLNPDPVAGMDGVAADESIRRYHDSFKTPPPVTNVINIGGGITGGGK
jgi:type IV pilus biogenesis protein CpaD/CtpE